MIFKLMYKKDILLNVWIYCALAMFVVTGITNGDTKLTKEEQKTWDESPKSIEELDPVTRKKYEMLKARYMKGESEYDKVIEHSYTANPLHKKAKQLRKMDYNIQKKLNQEGVKVKNYFKQLNEKDKIEKNRMRSYWSDMMGIKAMNTMLDDPDLRPYVLFFSKKMVERFQADSDSEDFDYKSIKPLFPAKGSKLNDKEYFDLYLEILNQVQNDKSSKYGKVSIPVDLPDFVLDYIELKNRHACQFIICDAYYRVTKSDKLKSIEKRIIEIGNEMSELWPRWKLAEIPEELRNPPKGLKPSSSIIRN